MKSHGPRKIGLIAGAGQLPLCFARRAKQEGNFLATIAVQGAASPRLASLSDSFQWVSNGQIGKLISALKKSNLTKVVMHGKVPHASLFKGLKLDFKALSLWASLEDRSGEGLLRGLASELKKNKIEVLDARYLMGDLLAPKGLLTKTKTTASQEREARFGLRQARSAAKLAIGQTLLVKKGAVAAVEGMEGTDRAALRAGSLAGPGLILAKASSPRQDWRFDVPTLGPATIQTLGRIKASGLVLEAGKVFLIDKEKMIEAADKKGIFILAV